MTLELIRVTCSTADRQKGFTLLELMIAAVILVLLFMAFLSTLTGSFLADTTATTANNARATAERLMEETLDLSYGDCLMVDQNAALTAQGLACKLGVAEITSGLLSIEVYVCKPTQPVTLAELAAMSLADVRDMESVPGGQVRLLCLKANR